LYLARFRKPGLRSRFLTPSQIFLETLFSLCAFYSEGIVSRVAHWRIIESDAASLVS